MAEKTLGGFGPEGIELWNTLVEEHRRRKQWGLTGPRHAPGPAWAEEDLPWVQVVLTPPGGIPAMWEETSENGTGSGTQGDFANTGGTGTSIGDAGDRPGFATCAVYRLMHNTTKGRALTHPRLQPTGDSIVVYNARFTAVNGSQFVTAVRDPWGDWWVPQNGDLFTTCT